MIVREVMNSNYRYLLPKQTIAEAICAFKTTSDSEGAHVFGMLVIDENNHLVGMLSMYDILQFIKPKNTSILGEMEDLSSEPLFDVLLERIKKIYVEDIMATDMVTVKPDTHIMVVVDIMLKKHIRRLPVIENDRVVGIIYRFSIFNYLIKKLIE